MKTYINLLITIFSISCLGISLQAQQLVMEWQGPPGEAPAYDGLSIGWNGAAGNIRDFNSDGVRDFTMFRLVNGEPQLAVVDGSDHEMRWWFDNGAEAITSNMDIWYFMITGADQLKDLVAGQRSGNRLIGVLEGGKVVADNGIIQFHKDYQLIDVDDFDNDGQLEMLFGNRSEHVIEIWGAL